MRLTAAVLGTPDPRGLARSYQGPAASLRVAGGSRVLRHVAPVWPPEPGTQQMQTHLDLEVDDLDAACALTEEAGARRIGGYDSPEEVVRVHADRAGHPFGLFVDVGNGSPAGADPA